MGVFISLVEGEIEKEQGDVKIEKIFEKGERGLANGTAITVDLAQNPMLFPPPYSTLSFPLLTVP